VLSRLFRPLMLEMLVAAHDAGRLLFFGDPGHLADKAAFKAYLAPLHRTKWFVYSKPSRCWPICRATRTGRDLQQPPHRRRRDRRHVQVQGLPDQGARPLQDYDAGGEFIRRFLMHVLPKRFHRIGTAGCWRGAPRPRPSRGRVS
jgi:hypothetical protein